MRKFSTTEARQDMARILDACRRQPVVIRYYQRDAAVLLSIAEYRRLQVQDGLASAVAAASKEADVV